MKRLTTDAPDGNFETLLNLVFGKDGWAHIRHDGDEGAVPSLNGPKPSVFFTGAGSSPLRRPRRSMKRYLTV